MTEHQNIAYDVDGWRATITLNRPERLNALTHRTIDEVKRAVTAAAEDSRVMCIVIRGAGRAFCAGDNLKGMGPTPYTGDRLNELLHASYYSMVNLIRDTGKPVITVAHGHTIGAGLELFMAGDIKLATADAKLGIPFAKLGIVGLNHQLVRYAGLTTAARIVFTGEPISGEEGKACGLVTEIIPSEAEIDARIDHWAEKFKDVSLHSIRLMKDSLYKAQDQTHEEWFHRWMLLSMTYMNNLERQERIAEWLAARGATRLPPDEQEAD